MLEKTTIAPKMLSINQTAQQTGISEYLIRQLVLKKKIKFIKSGKKYLINFDSFIEFLNTGERKSNTEEILKQKIGVNNEQFTD